jgi:hypothetical protein
MPFYIFLHVISKESRIEGDSSILKALQNTKLCSEIKKKRKNTRIQRHERDCVESILVRRKH